MELTTLIKNIEDAMPTVDLEAIARKYNVKEENALQYERMMSGDHCANYYRALAVAAANKHVCELGCFFGGSTICLANKAVSVDTYDIDVSKLLSTIHASEIVVHKCENNEAIFNIKYDWYNLIFVDIAHNGPEELRLHNIFKQTFKGLVFWDDVDNSWPGMKTFWEKVDVPKALTNWHSGSGFGVSLYE